MIAALSHLTSVAIVASSSGPGWLLVAGPAGGGGLYYALFQYYRNTKKSHSFETETRVAAQPVTGHEQKVNEVKGTRKSSIDGDNHDKHRQRVQRVS